jgi:hypothetical protein
MDRSLHVNVRKWTHVVLDGFTLSTFISQIDLHKFIVLSLALYNLDTENVAKYATKYGESLNFNLILIVLLAEKQ